MQAGMGITDDIIQGKISCFRNKFHKHKEKCSEKRKFLGALCLRSESWPLWSAPFLFPFIFCVLPHAGTRFPWIEEVHQNFSSDSPFLL